MNVPINQVNQATPKPPYQSPCNKSAYYRLILITNKQHPPLQDYLKFIRSCALAGITAVQLREKDLPYAELLEFGKKIQETLTPFNIPLIINDNIKLALALDAAGVHLGQTDGCPQKARAQLGSEKIIGVSIDSLTNLQEANQLPLDYVGIGSIFTTKNKTNVRTHWGITGLKQLAALSTHPVVAIGGINEQNAADIWLAGAQGIAAIGAFHEATDRSATIQKLLYISQKEPS